MVNVRCQAAKGECPCVPVDCGQPITVVECRWNTSLRFYGGDRAGPSYGQVEGATEKAEREVCCLMKHWTADCQQVDGCIGELFAWNCQCSGGDGVHSSDTAADGLPVK